MNHIEFTALLPLACIAIIGAAILALEVLENIKSRSQYIGVEGSIRTISKPIGYMTTAPIPDTTPKPSKKEQRIQAAGKRLTRHANHTRIVNSRTTVFRVSCDVVSWSEDKVRTEHVWQAIAIPASSAIDLEPVEGGGYRIKGDRS